MDVKEAVAKAKEHIALLFADENISNVGLEEVEHDQAFDEWKITIGFSRPWDVPRNAFTALAGAGPHRSYKVVRIASKSGTVVSVKNRDAAT
jgi:hypothetical protein